MTSQSPPASENLGGGLLKKECHNVGEELGTGNWLQIETALNIEERGKMRKEGKGLQGEGLIENIQIIPDETFAYKLHCIAADFIRKFALII